MGNVLFKRVIKAFEEKGFKVVLEDSYYRVIEKNQCEYIGTVPIQSQTLLKRLQVILDGII